MHAFVANGIGRLSWLSWLYDHRLPKPGAGAKPPHRVGAPNIQISHSGEAVSDHEV